MLMELLVWDTSESLKDVTKIEKCLLEYVKMIIMEMIRITQSETVMKGYSQQKM